MTIAASQLYWDKEAYKPVLSLQDVQIDQSGKTEVFLKNASIAFSVEGLLALPPRPPIEIYLDNLDIDLDALHKDQAATVAPEANTTPASATYMDKLQKLPASSIVLRDSKIQYGGYVSTIHSIKITPGTVSQLQIFQAPSREDLRMEVDLSNKGRVVLSGKIYDETDIQATADYSGSNIILTAVTGAIDSKDLLNIWPRAAAVGTRSWLESNLLAGTITSSKLNITAASGPEKDRFEVENVTADIAIAGATISYMDGAPQLKNLNAEITIINDKIAIKASSATLQDVPLHDLAAEITDVVGENSELILHGEINGSLLPIIDIALSHTEEHEFNLTNIKGKAEATVDLMIPLMTSNPKSIDVSAKLTEVEADNIQGKHGITNGNLLVSYKNGDLEVKGQALIDKALDSQITYLLPGDKTTPAKTEIITKVTAKNLKEMGLVAPDFFKNSLPLKYTILDGRSEIQHFIELDIHNNIDPNNPALSLLNLGDIKGKFKSQIVPTAGGTVLKDYTLKMAALSSEGDIILDDNYSVASIESRRTKFNDSDFSMLYEDREDQQFLEVKGKRFDLSNLSLGKLIKKSGGMAKPFMLRSSLKKLGMYNGLVINAPELYAQCSPTLCTLMVLKGKFDSGNSFNMTYKYPDLSLYSDNAGDSLRALNIYTKMTGGLLATTVKMAPEGGTTKGNVDISNYHLTKTPILAKLLSVTAASSVSFSGLADLIKGKGIGFKKLKCPIIYGHNLLILDDCVQSGDVMNMTAKGTFNMAAETLDITGVVAPTNFVNSISRKIPILRQLGGGENGGLITMSYTMKGKIKDDITINVNPLSILAPGFLKGH